MYSYDHQIRVRYSETDKMGYVYYGHYFTYFEVTRVESLRALGYNYKDLEEEGVLLPVMENTIKFLAPATYDELLTIKGTVPEMPSVKLKFNYDVFNEAGKLINQAETILAFVDAQSGKPTRPPEVMLNLFRPFF